MGFRQSVLSAFFNGLDFRGRASRAEYWYFVLFNLAVFEMHQFLTWQDRAGKTGANFERMFTTYDLIVIVPFYAVSVRRLHDTGRSGWWQLLDLPANLAMLGYAMLSMQHPHGAMASGLSLPVLVATVCAMMNMVLKSQCGLAKSNAHGSNPLFRFHRTYVTFR